MMPPSDTLSLEDARREELERALRRLAAGVEPRIVIEEMSRRLANKLLHAPIVALRDGSAKARELHS